jgi:predicted DNA-binding transcriptional regulator AlpA
MTDHKVTDLGRKPLSGTERPTNKSHHTSPRRSEKAPRDPGIIPGGIRDRPHRRLLSKSEVLAIARVSYPTLWTWMRNGTFPRSRVVGGRSMWLSDEIDAWLAELPIRPLKGDAAV